MTRITLAIGASAVLAVAASATAQTSVRTGPNSSASPYVRPSTGSPVRDIVSILTVGDGIGGYQMVGIPDGMGAFNNNDGTFTVTMNHELTAVAGAQQHAHQPSGFAGGSFVSKWTITPGTFAVSAGSDAMTSVVTTTNGTGGTLYNFARFCSADLAAQSAFYNAATGNGTPGRMMALDVETGISYQLQAFDVLEGGWETGVARPYASDTTVVMGTSDGGANRVFMYVGTKQSTGTPVEMAGLKGGTGYGVQVQVNGSNVTTETTANCFGTSSPVYSGTFTFATGGTAAGTTFLRPEDGAWDPANPTDFYFVTTASMTTNSRLFRMRFSDVNNPLAGGTIEALPAGGTMVIMQEDPGNNAHNAKTHLYNVATDTRTTILESDPARFGNGTSAATAPFNQDEENSGVIDARDQLGLGWFIGNMQAHYAVANPLVEGGQLYAFYCPSCVGICDADLATPYNVIGGEDLANILGHWGEAYGAADLNRDGNCDGVDLGALLNGWGNCAP
ncbi:MAG: hypothetical protein EBU31_03285 [Proteobacteria bacterium]|nr:hypothetical protein [Pseudomonadota bacterium]